MQRMNDRGRASTKGSAPKPRAASDAGTHCGSVLARGAAVICSATMLVLSTGALSAVAGCQSNSPTGSPDSTDADASPVSLTSAPAAADASLATPDGADATGWRWAPSSHHVYALKLKSAVAVGGKSSLLSFSLTGKVHLDVRRRDASTFEFVSRVSEARFEETGRDKEADYHALAEELTQPQGFTLTHGRLHAVHLPKRWSNFAATIGRAIAAAWQAPHLTPDGEYPFETDEVDATGKHQVTYSPIDACQTGKLCFSKQTLQYSQLNFPGLPLGGLTASLKPEVVSSTATLTFTPEQSLDALHSLQQLKLPVGPAAAMQSTTELSLSRDATVAMRSTIDWQQALENTRTLSATQPYMGPVADTYDHLKVGNYTYQSALAALVAQHRKEKTIREAKAAGTLPKPGSPQAAKNIEQELLQERAGPFRAMAGILRTQPQHIASAVRDIKKQGPATRSLIDALSTAETAACAEALVALLADKSLPAAWRGAIASGIIRSQDTRPETVQALKGILTEPEIRVHAYYGLGSIARRLAESGHAKRADDTALILAHALTTESEQSVIIHALRGISNSGRTVALSAVGPHLQAKSPIVRAAAVQALRLMDSPRADTWIADTLLNDKKKTVRRAAAAAASEHKPTDTLLTAVQNAVSSDPDAKVRQQLVSLLARWLPERPELRATLTYIQAEDERPSIRREAQESLTNHPL